MIDTRLEYSNSLGKEFYSIDINRPFVTATTKYGGGFEIRETFTGNDLDTLSERAPVKYNLIDAWFGRSFMIDSANLTRLVLSARYIHNNVYWNILILSFFLFSQPLLLSVLRTIFFKGRLQFQHSLFVASGYFSFQGFSFSMETGI